MFSTIFPGSGNNPKFLKLRMLRCPAQCDGLPIAACSSKTVTSVPSLARFRAVKEPAGPPPTTMASDTVFISYTLDAMIISLLNKLDASLSTSHRRSANFAADL